MATVNIDVTNAWTKVADDTDDPVLVQCSGQQHWQFALVATDTDPTVIGHHVFGTEELVSRAVVGAGFIFAKLSNVDATIPFIVTK